LPFVAWGKDRKREREREGGNEREREGGRERERMRYFLLENYVILFSTFSTS